MVEEHVRVERAMVGRMLEDGLDWDTVSDWERRRGDRLTGRHARQGVVTSQSGG